jgi:ASC-1-like (ASCH) protein
MRTLTLPLKSEYFDQIKSGEKLYEFRLQNEYWAKRLEGREYDQIILTKGYPKRDDQERRITRPWNGFEKTTITHPHFGSDPVQVYAINVN